MASRNETTENNGIQKQKQKQASGTKMSEQASGAKLKPKPKSPTLAESMAAYDAEMEASLNMVAEMEIRPWKSPLVLPTYGNQSWSGMASLTAMLEYEGTVVLQSGNPEYERAVACSNLLYRYARPDYVVRPKTIGGVQTIVEEARRRKKTLAIKGGGNSFIGASFFHGDIVIDMKDMNRIEADL
jgi:hypothetical protein